MGVGKYDFTVKQGETLSIPFTYKDSNGDPYDVTNYVVTMYVKNDVSSSTVVASYSTAGSTIVLGGSTGTITINMSSTSTNSLTGDNYVYDIKMVKPDTSVTYLVEGKIYVDKKITT